MRINRVQNNVVSFKQLEVRSTKFLDIKDFAINECRKRLEKTKNVDVVIDSHGIAIKKKMTEVLQRIQSFSLFTQENAVGINFDKGEDRVYKFKYDSFELAKQAWKDLYEKSNENSLETYTKVALLIENLLK